MRAKTLLIGSAAGLLFALGLALMAGPASALTINGDWVVSGVESYSNDTITVVSVNGTGNIYILPGGELHLANVLVILPNNRTFDNQGYLELRNSTVRSPSWFFYLRSAADLSDVSLFNVSRNTGGGLSGTVITNQSVALQRVRWEYTVTGPSEQDWFIHVRTVLSFKDNYIGRYGQLSYELPTITSDVTIEIANNRFQMGVGTFGMGAEGTTALVIDNALHSGAVVYDIHHNNFTDGVDAIFFGSSSSSTTYNVHHNVFTNIGSTAIEVGDGAAADRFGGVLRMWDLSISQSNRAIRIYGVIGGGGVATADNISIRHTGCAMCFPPTGIHANEMTIVLTNSTIQLSGDLVQYRSEQNGHIRIYSTADLALRNVEVAQTGASVEHFAFLAVTGASWQNSVPILSQVVSLREATGNLSLTLDPQNWTPREIVWWGYYYQAPQVDNRDLRPEIQDGGRTFPCAPSPFLVTDPMSPLALVCTDNLAPTITVAKPTANQLQNTSTLSGNGSGSEYGSGLNTFEWSFDNASWGPVALGPGAMDWRVSALGLTDGTYTLYLRAVDRTGLASYRSVTGIRVDLTPPTLTIPELVNFTTDFQLNISGATESLASVTYVLGASQPVTTVANATGVFTFPNIALSEGHNTLWVTATDSAGNQFSIQRNITVDTVPPALLVDQDPYLLTALDTIEISGLSEATATVLVNGIVASRGGQAFSAQLSLLPGVNSITVTATDPAGNQAVWFGRAASDADPPIVLASIITGNVTAGGIPVTRVGSVPITGTVTDAASGIALLTINGSAYLPDGSGAFLVSLPVGEGDTEIRISATDRAGNVAIKTLHVIRDSTPPTAVSTLEVADAPFVTIGNAVYTRGDFVLVSLIMSEDGEATVAGETRPVQSGANFFNVTLNEGQNTISISFLDNANNTGAPRTLGIVRDRTPPDISITTPTNSTLIDEATTAVSGVSEAGARVTVNGRSVSLAGTGFTTTVEVPHGQATTITAVATDELGNTAQYSVTVTRRPPPVDTPTGDASSALVFLVVGAAAGIGAGFVMRGGSKRREAVESLDPASPEPSAAPAAEPQARGPKGPKGPAPPGG